MENSILKRRLARGAGHASAALLLVGAVLSMSSCEDDLLTGTPSWLGSSIYEELESRGNFQTTLALINDPDLSETNYPEMLRRTGSMTLFVADDAAWNRYLSARGISSVNRLPKAEKKNLLKAAMINNAYLIELLSNTPGDPPTEGACMRRASRVDVTDSIPVMHADEFPIINPVRVNDKGEQVDYWAAVRDREEILIYYDNNPIPMVHFLPDFMVKNDLGNADVEKLTNGSASDVNHTSYINGRKVIEQDITCQNGYIHVLEEVPEQLDNMAQIIHSKPQFSIFSELLDRWSYPQFLSVQTADGKSDSLFVKRYFNNGHQDHSLNQIDESNTTVSTVLTLDPGWNRYRLNTNNTGVSFANDGAAMFVPTNEWMDYYLHHDGAAIGAKYDYDWRNVPDNVVLPFINNCMKASFISSAPTKFGNVKNTAAEPMGIALEDVDSCFMACNGVIYQLNKVFVAPEHQSVLFPVTLRADQDLSIVNQAITDSRYNKVDIGSAAWRIFEYQAYLNSMSSSYSFLIPQDTAFAAVIDPYSIFEKKPIGIRYFLDSSSSLPVRAQAYNAELDSTTMEYVITDQLAPNSQQPTAMAFVNNRITDLMENVIVIHGLRGTQTFHPGQTVYLNKAGAPVFVRFEGDKVTGVAGTYHYERGEWIPVESELIFDQTESGNGVSYVIPSIPSSTITSPYAALHDAEKHPDYSTFANLLTASCSFMGSEISGHPTMDFGFTNMANYHYTIWVPTNESVQALIDSGKLPTWETMEEWANLKDSLTEYQNWMDAEYRAKQFDEELYEQRQAEIEDLTDRATAYQSRIRDVIENFIRYHIQDGSVYIGGPDSTGVYETAVLDTAMSRFRRLDVSNQGGSITVKDIKGNIAHVIPGANSNVVSRQYLFTRANRYIYASSYVVLHSIDRVLEYADEQFLPDDFPQPTYPEWLQQWLTEQSNSNTKRR